MKLVFGSVITYESYCKIPVKNFLISQIYKEQVSTFDKICASSSNDLFLIVDSGAFSAWSTGKTIDREDYYKTIIELTEKFSARVSELHFVNLDVIPGSKFKKPSISERLASAEKGWENYLWFKDKGVKNLIHVYHQYEPISVLQRMIDNGCSYIGISPDNLSPCRKRWLEHVFKYIPDSIRTHGFGVTAEELLINFPWYSVDSISYALSSGFGSFLTFSLLSDNHMRVFKCSDRRIDIPIEHYCRVEKYLQKLGEEFTISSVAQSIALRINVSVDAFLKLEEFCNKNPPQCDWKLHHSIFDFV